MQNGEWYMGKQPAPTTRTAHSTSHVSACLISILHFTPPFFILPLVCSLWSALCDLYFTLTVSSGRIATKDRHFGSLDEPPPTAFPNHALAPSPVHVNIGKLSPRKNNFVRNRQPLFLVEILILLFKSSLMWGHVDFHEGRHIVFLGTWGEPPVNTIPGPFLSVLHGIGLGTSAQRPVVGEGG